MGGRLITLEGLDGAGKTTVARGLVARFGDLELLREPGGVVLAERLRALVLDPEVAVDPRAEALIYAAARAQLVAERLVPALEAGRDVLLDRFVDSSLAYQGAGRELGVEAVREVNAFATAGLVPDLTLLLALPVDVGRARQAGRAGAPDRLEREEGGFWSRVAGGYEALAAAEPGRIVVLDATRPAPEVLAAAETYVAGLLAA